MDEERHLPIAPPQEPIDRVVVGAPFAAHRPHKRRDPVPVDAVARERQANVALAVPVTLTSLPLVDCGGRSRSGNVGVSKSSVGKGKEARRGDNPEVALGDAPGNSPISMSSSFGWRSTAAK